LTEVERLRDALDHIIRQCSSAQKGNRRLDWIKSRAQLALDGVEDWSAHLKGRPPILDNFPTPEARTRKDKITAILVECGFRVSAARCTTPWSGLLKHTRKVS